MQKQSYPELFPERHETLMKHQCFLYVRSSPPRKPTKYLYHTGYAFPTTPLSLFRTRLSENELQATIQYLGTGSNRIKKAGEPVPRYWMVACILVKIKSIPQLFHKGFVAFWKEPRVRLFWHFNEIALSQIPRNS